MATFFTLVGRRGELKTKRSAAGNGKPVLEKRESMLPRPDKVRW
jgi:hypothetical protein